MVFFFQMVVVSRRVFPKAYNIVAGWGINDLIRAKTVKLTWKPSEVHSVLSRFRDFLDWTW